MYVCVCVCCLVLVLSKSGFVDFAKEFPPPSRCVIVIVRYSHVPELEAEHVRDVFLVEQSYHAHQALLGVRAVQLQLHAV